MPAGFSKYTLLPAISDRIRPSIDEREPPVTRAMMFSIEPGPLKVAVSPVARSNWRKLWKRFRPRASLAPSSGVTR